MALAQGIRAGAAYVELYANNNQLVRGLRAAQRRLRAFSASVNDIGMRMLRMSAVMSAPFVAGVKVFADFEQQLANVATMLERPEEHLPRFREGLRDMAEEFGESTETLAAGLYDILSASVPAEQALDVLAVSARAAKAGLTDTGTAADAITTILNSYGLSADRAGEVSDWLFSIVKRGKTTFGQLAPNIGNVATIASTAGVSLDELGASIATLTRNGIKTEESITAVNAIIGTFLKPSAEGAAAARELGFELNAATLQSEGLVGVFQRIAQLPPDALARMFPNVRALKGVLPALQNLEGFTDDVDAMKNRAGATEQAYSRMANTLSTTFARLKQAAFSVLSVIGEAIAEPVANATNAIRRYVGMVREWLQSNKQMVITALKVVGVIAAVGAVLVAVGIAGQALVFIMGGIGAIIAAVGTIFGFLGTAIAAILSPIGLVITALVALTAYILYATGTGAKALEWLGEKFGRLKTFALASLQGISDALAAGDMALAVRVLWLSIQVAWRKGVHTIKEYWLGFKEWFLGITTRLFYGAVSLLADAWYGLQLIWVETATFMANVWTRLTQHVGKAWNTVQDWLAKRITELWGLFDEDVDVEATKRLIDEDTTRRNQEIDREAERTIAGRERARQQRQNEILDERNGVQRQITDDANRELRERRERYDRELQESQGQLDQARSEWQAAVTEARNKREELEAGSERPEAEEKPTVDVPEVVRQLENSLSGVGDRLDEAVKTSMDVTGTFNVEAIGGLGIGQTAQERTAKATEETARNTKQIARQAGEGQLAFG